MAAGEDVTLTVDFAKPGVASVLVLDRDGYAIRTLTAAEPVRGTASFRWNGRDDRGELVADEAYSFRVEWRGDGATDVYNPGEEITDISAIDVGPYDRRTGTLSYTLPRPARVHIQAGTAVADPTTKELIGPVMKTVVNREPRMGGAIAEHWNGYDESGSIFVPDLENFVVAIAASALPENSILTFGNRERHFVDTLARRRGTSFFHRQGHPGHHAGLRTEDDLSPALKIEPLNATWSEKEHAWVFNDSKRLRVRMTIAGPTASAFLRHPATIELFVDGRRVHAQKRTTEIVEIPLDRRDVPQRVSINWNSEWGPVAANTIQVRSAASSRTARSSK